MAAGYLYVLVNSSMPGLVKVGKTTRAPSDRANELSNTTGVPTPFVVAFDDYFEDCDVAERLVHSELEKRGLRQSMQREFFRASASEVIKIILEKLKIKEKNLKEERYEKTVKIKNTIDSGFSRFVSNPWDDLLSMAYQYYFGDKHDDRINHKKSLDLFNQAKNLGSLLACEEIGMMQALGEGCEPSDLDAFQTFAEGAKKGNYYCLALLADFYINSILFENNDEKNFSCNVNLSKTNIKKFHIYWKYFFLLRKKFVIFEIENHSEKYNENCVVYIKSCLDNNFGIENHNYMKDDAEKIKNYCIKMSHKISINKFIGEYSAVIDWIDGNLIDSECQFDEDELRCDEMKAG